MQILVTGGSGFIGGALVAALLREGHEVIPAARHPGPGDGSLKVDLSKDLLRSLPLSGAIVQPSLVYGAGGSSARLFNTPAIAPVLMLPRSGAMQVQSVHRDDVVAGVLALLRGPPRQAATVVFAGSSPTGIVSLGVYPVQDSLALLARVGLHGTAAVAAVHGAAFMDPLLGVYTVASPSRWHRPVWAARFC